MSRLRSEEGFTLSEMLVAATAGFVVLAAIFGLLDSSLRLSSGTVARTDAMQRGRLAADRVTQQLRSQVCLDLTTPAILPGATADSVTFYSDFGNGDRSVPPDRRTLTFNPTTGAISESVVPGVEQPDGSYTFTGAAQPNLVLESAAAQTKKVNGIDQPVPFFRYYAYERTGNPQVLRASEALTTPLSAAAAARVAKIEIAFTALPTRMRDPGRYGTNIEDIVSIRHADPNLTVPDPMCV